MKKIKVRIDYFPRENERKRSYAFPFQIVGMPARPRSGKLPSMIFEKSADTIAARLNAADKHPTQRNFL